MKIQFVETLTIFKLKLSHVKASYEAFFFKAHGNEIVPLWIQNYSRGQ
jgi:hypothetical protein